MRSEKGKRKKAGIYFFSISIHTLLICLLAFPFLKSEKMEEDLFRGLLVQFDAQKSISAKRSKQKNPSNNPHKKAAETKFLKPKLEKSGAPKKAQKSEKKPTQTKVKKSNKKADSKSPEQKQTLTEKRRDYLVNQLQQAELNKKKALEAEKRKAELEEKANKEKYEKMKSAFSHLLKNANHETPSHHSDLKLSDKSMSLTHEDADSGTTESISNRKVLFVPKIEDQSQKEGRVVIKICVNGAGNVISARYTQLGSTTTDSYLINLATKNAKLYRFSKSDSPKQCGIVNIDFEVR